jgi:hypothetical protein
MSKLDLGKFAPIMIFYAILTYIIGPLFFYFLIEKSAASAGNGFVAGAILSIILWYGVGSKMV